MAPQKIRIFFAAIALIFTGFSEPSFSQTCSLCQASVPGSRYVQGTGFHLTGEYTVGTSGVSHITAFSSSQMLSLSGLVEGLTIAVSIPYTRRSVETVIDGKQLELNSSGLGDLLLYGRYNLLETPLSAVGGIKLPTAEVGFGSDSTEILIGLSGSKTLFPFLFYGESVYRLVTKSSSILDYRLGVGYPLFSGLYLLSDLAGSSGAEGVFTYVSFGSQFVTGRWSLTFMFQHPIIQRLERPMEVRYTTLGALVFYLR